MKRLYHEDGRAYTQDEYRVFYERKSEKLKDYLVIFVILFLSQVVLFANLFGALYLYFALSYFYLFELCYAWLFTSIIWPVFDYSIRKKKSRLLFLAGSCGISVSAFCIRLMILLVLGGNQDIRGVPLMVGDSLYFQGALNLYLYDLITYMPLLAVVLFLYNPFKDVK